MQEALWGTTWAANNWRPHLPKWNPVSKINVSQRVLKNKEKYLEICRNCGHRLSACTQRSPAKKRRLLAIPRSGSKQRERNMLCAILLHRSKALLIKTHFFFRNALGRCQTFGLSGNSDNKKAEMIPKLHTKKVHTKLSHSGLNTDCFITLMDSSRFASGPAFTPGEMGTEVCNSSLRSLYPLHGFWLYLRGVISSAH